jgi:hypothetical protein
MGMDDLPKKFRCIAPGCGIGLQLAIPVIARPSPTLGDQSISLFMREVNDGCFDFLNGVYWGNVVDQWLGASLNKTAKCCHPGCHPTPKYKPSLDDSGSH